MNWVLLKPFTYNKKEFQMSQSYIKLNPKQCNSLLEAIVDCDPELYEMIKNCAQIYKKDPDLYDIQYINQQIKKRK